LIKHKFLFLFSAYSNFNFIFETKQMIFIPGSWHLGPFGAGEKKKTKKEDQEFNPLLPHCQ